MKKKTVRDVDVQNKRVLVRVDYNVPFAKGTTRISDDFRIHTSVPTIRYLVRHNAAVILCTHLGRPGGKVQEELRMTPVARRLSELLGREVRYVQEAIGPQVKQAVEELQPGQILLLENLRFYPGEEKNDPEFAKELASLADVYVDDAFSVAHRAHASTEGITHFLPSVAGLRMEKEVEMLGRALDEPTRPLAAVIGGAKVSDKISVLEHLTQRVDMLFIGGGMAATFLKAKDCKVGGSLVEDEFLGFARQLIQDSQSGQPKLFLPTDVVVADAFDADANHQTLSSCSIPDGWNIMDIGPETAKLFDREMSKCKTIVWNGPMGVFEWPAFAQGTRSVAQTMADLGRTTRTIVGGGSTAEAVEEFGFEDAMSHVSMGGGASLEFLEGKELPGIAALLDRQYT